LKRVQRQEKTVASRIGLQERRPLTMGHIEGKEGLQRREIEFGTGE
jgi:hypothetical protein